MIEVHEPILIFCVFLKIHHDSSSSAVSAHIYITTNAMSQTRVYSMKERFVKFTA